VRIEPKVDRVASFPSESLAGAEDLAGLEALRADVQPLGRAVHERPDALDVRRPPPIRAAVRVAHLHPEPGFPPANLAHGCHDNGDGNRRVELRRAVGLSLGAVAGRDDRLAR
jgi:hypothetical protein